MYSVLPSFVLGFHGCDEAIANKVFAGKSRLKKSTNEWDWLGSGIYFWENNPQRALEYARHLKRHPERGSIPVNKPAVVGAVIDLGYCLNLLDEKSIQLVKSANEVYLATCMAKGVDPVENKNIEGSKELLLRYRDCAVIESLHAYREEAEIPVFASVRGMFAEGRAFYKNAGFHAKNHIQICIRNPNCIKGYFRVLDPEANWPVP